MSKPFAITLDVGTSLANLTGTWRNERPEYLDHLPPCNNACPAGENIQAWLYLAEEGDYEGAWREIMVNNPMPAVMGRACYHPCESACNRQHVDEAVGIHAVERFLGDLAIERGWSVDPVVPPTGKKVMVLGAGPGGLSAAYHLARLGHSVTVYDASEKPGGMLRYGIPLYRLPREALDGDIRRIAGMSVTFKVNTRIDDIEAERKNGGYDACFVAIGAQLARTLEFPTDGSIPMYEAINVLRQVEAEPESSALGKRTAIYGGGNVAMDVARSAVRLGAKDVLVVVFEAREQMPAHKFEIKEALEEGVRLSCLRSVKAAENGMVTLEEMVLDDNNRPQPTGRLESVAVDSLVLAIGQLIETSLVENLPGVTVVGGALQVDEHMMTGCPGVFAGGDMVPSMRTMTTAIGHGKKAARNIDAFLKGEIYHAPPKHEIADIEKVNDWYYADAPKTVQPVLELIRRQSGFEEVLGNLDEDNALYEARRCMSCGNCFECDTCYGVCPDNAVIKLGPGNRFRFNYDYCKGCGLCVAECPCGAIKMVPEDI